MLRREQVRAIYDSYGARQDEQAYYEDPAVDALIAHAGLSDARHVFEFGCGTGRLAARLLRDVLPPAATYYGVDLSSTMVQLAAQRLMPFGPRAAVARAEGFRYLPLADRSVDAMVSTYVFDLLAVCRREGSRVVFFPLTPPGKEFGVHQTPPDTGNGSKH